MKRQRGYYSLVQYCPDASRAEVANIGVLLFVPEAQFIKVRLSDNNKRIKRFFGKDSFNPRMISAAGDALVAQLTVEKEAFEVAADLQNFIASQANEVVLTEARAITVEQPHADLEALYQELVAGVSAPMSDALAASGPWFKSVAKLTTTLDRLASERPNLVRRRPVISFPESKIKIRPDYTFENGHLNLVELLSIPTQEQAIENYAFRFGGQSEFITRHFSNGGGSPDLLVVSTPKNERDDLRTAEALMKEVLEDYDHAMLIPFAELEEFTARIEREVS